MGGSSPWRDPTWVEIKRQARHQQEKLAKAARDAKRNPGSRKKAKQTGLVEWF